MKKHVLKREVAVIPWCAKCREYHFTLLPCKLQDLEIAVARLFTEQAITISKSECEVRLQFNNLDETDAVFEWLFQLGEKSYE